MGQRISEDGVSPVSCAGWFQIPCQILQRGRRLLYRLLNVNDWTETLLSGVPSPKRVRYG